MDWGIFFRAWVLRGCGCESGRVGPSLSEWSESDRVRADAELAVGLPGLGDFLLPAWTCSSQSRPWTGGLPSGALDLG